MAIDFADTSGQPPLFVMTPEQIEKLRSDLARLVGEREREQAMKAESMKAFNETLKELEKRISEAARIIREQTGEEIEDDQDLEADDAS